MNREMRRLQAKEEERAKRRREDKARAQKKERVGFFQYVREVRQELKKVAWPSRHELTTYTVVVFGVSAILTLLVFAMDWVFNTAVLRFVETIT